MLTSNQDNLVFDIRQNIVGDCNSCHFDLFVQRSRDKGWNSIFSSSGGRPRLEFEPVITIRSRGILQWGYAYLLLFIRRDGLLRILAGVGLSSREGLPKPPCDVTASWANRDRAGLQKPDRGYSDSKTTSGDKCIRYGISLFYSERVERVRERVLLFCSITGFLRLVSPVSRNLKLATG